MDILSYILGKKAGGGGGEAVLINKSVTANGTYNASSDSADGYKKVEVSVPNTYAAGDEGKVVSNGALVAQGSDTVTANDTYDTTLISSLTVNVAGASLPKLLNHIEFTPASDIDSSNKQTISIGTATRYVCFVLVREAQAAPASGYTAMNWVKFNFDSSAYAQKGSVLRMDDTIGTDEREAEYDGSTGNIDLGGPFGTYRAGVTYDIYLFEAV